MFHGELVYRTHSIRQLMNEALSLVSKPTRPLLLILATLAIIAHINALSCGWIWDDDSYITANQLIQSPDSLLTIWKPGAFLQYYPLVLSGFWVEHAAFGLQPFSFHLINVLLHAASAVMLFRLLRAIAIPHAFWIAALFAVHPMTVESVAWATERKNVQSMFFALASALLFMRSLDASSHRRLGFWLASFMLFACALLSKSTAIFIPPCLIMLALWTRRDLNRWYWLRVIPFFALGIASGLFTAYIEKTQVGAVGGDFAFTVAERLQLASRNFLFYGMTFFVPLEQVFIYPRWNIDTSNWILWTAAIVDVLIITRAFFAWRRTRAPLLLVLWIGAGVVPALGFIDVWPFRFSFVADHFAYAAIPALATVFVACCAIVLAYMKRSERALDVTMALVITICIALSWRATAKYANEETLWRDTAAANPTAWIAHNNLATILLGQAGEAITNGDTAPVERLAQDALDHASMAYELCPSEMTAAVNCSEALRLLGRNEEALLSVEDAIAHAPQLAQPLWLRGRLLELLGRDDEARAALLAAAEHPTDRSAEVFARRDLMRLALARNDYAEAINQCKRIIDLDRFNADMIANLGALYAASGNKQQGMRELWRALSIRQNFSSKAVFTATALRYVQVALTTTLEPGELRNARFLADELQKNAKGDVSLRYLQYALLLANGDERARTEIEAIEKGARAADATAFADEIAQFLATHPPATP